MRRISLALALIGATAAGCGGNKPADNGGARGVAEGTFTITVQNGQNGNISLAIKGGYVTSTPAGIDCGEGAHAVCSFDFPATAPVTLTAVRTTGAFYGWAADCSGVGNTCVLEAGKADRYVLANFTQFTGHPNWTPTASTTDAEEHGIQARTLLASIPFTSPWQCAACHGGGLQGAGNAPACTGCHSAGSATVVVAPATKPAGETCTECHATQGQVHQATYDKYADASTLVATIVSVVSTETAAGSGKFNVTVTFDLKKDGAAFVTDITKLAQKTVYVTKYDSATRQFTPSTSLATLAAVSATPGRYTAKNNVGATTPVYAAFAPELSNAMVYAYFAENPTLIPAKGNYRLYDNVASVAQEFGDVDTFVSSVNVTDCEKCHGAPYMKHGYRAGPVAGIPDMAACKACHYDTRSGGHAAWSLLAEDPATYAAQNGTTTAEQNALYAYTANTMNDTHMSHAMEFAYPQTMANCTTCHTGKLGMILTDAKFTLTTCRSCHPVTAKVPDDKRAPPLKTLVDDKGTTDTADDVVVSTGVMPADHQTWNLYSNAPAAEAAPACNSCHSAAGGAPVFSAIHTGFNPIIYADTSGTKYSQAFTAAITAASATGNVLSVTATITETPDVPGLAVDDVNPTIYFAPYGYDTKDFILAALNQDTTASAALKTGFTRSCAVASNVKTCTVTVDVAAAAATNWTSRITSGAIKRVELAVLPTLKNAAAQTLALNAVTRTFDLAANAFADGFYPAITDPAKCNKCHEALATTFHSGNRGGSVVACRVCHVPLNGGSHLPMQSRSIDSYVHAIHSMQPFDPGDIDFSDPVEELHYEHHIESTYPNFTTLNCESCHNPGMYNIADQTKSLPGILSANDPGMPFSVPSVVTGPSARACGGCHRAALINEGDVAGLDAFDTHTKEFGYREADSDGAGPITTTTILNDIIGRLFAP